MRVGEIENGGQTCRIRSVVPEDILRVYEIESNVFGDDKFDILLLRDLLGNSLLFVVLEDVGTGVIVGFCILLGIDSAEAATSGDYDPQAEPAAHVVNIALEEPYRYRGWGKILMQYSIGQLMLLGYKRVQLEVNVANTPAITLYQNLGFRRVKRLPNYYQSGADAFRMEKLLHGTADLKTKRA
jgi:ribosomal-protein-alanine N-acetyltransferase